MRRNLATAMVHHRITAADVNAARAVFEANESRDLFYRAATELVDLALRRETSLSVAEALAVLLQTWNRTYYQFHRFDGVHFVRIESLLSEQRAALEGYRARAIDSLDTSDQGPVTALFLGFELVLGPVGAAKALHLLAPRLFALWDRAIAKAYHLPLAAAGSNGDRYWRFLLIAKEQCLDLARQESGWENRLKSIDEYNYCRYTKGWLS